VSDAHVRKRIVFDTGVVLQAALSDAGPSFSALRLMGLELMVVVLSPQVREEYEDVLTRPAIRAKNPQLTEERAQAFLIRIDERTETVTVIRPCLGNAQKLPH